MAIQIIKKDIIEKAFENNDRQYMIGNLKVPQELEFIFDENVEMGISDIKHYQVDKVHYHSNCKEYQYIISGKNKYLDLNKHKTYELSKGDVYMIETNAAYYQKSLAGTRILFIKVPGGNDKYLVELSEEQMEWGKDYDNDGSFI